MAKQIQLEREKLMCLLCLEILNDPVTIPCGHSYCMSCIQRRWSRRGLRNTFTCPQCSQTSSAKPVLVKNTVLAALVEHLRKAEPTAATQKGQQENEVGDLLPQAQPQVRSEISPYLQQISLDPDTANAQLALSDGNRRVTFTEQKQLYRPHPDRFISNCQVLSRESLSGRCYCEVEWQGFRVSVAVAYKSISRAGEESCFGYTKKSWSLDCYLDGYDFRHNNIQTSVSGPGSSRVGVYLDHNAGILSFYSVQQTRSLLHTVQTTFTEPLYVGLWLGLDSTADFCLLEKTEL